MSVYLKSLEISGFKSFGQRTYLEFSEGITGIVGPNGCGKSNVVESMKWVLGEQSAKSLRGDKMQDIIFAGTKHRSAAGLADVALTFNNELQWLPLEFPEVSIGRRVFRSGEGQYFVNGVRSRLKDTTELFLDTGVGKDSYAIFEQGKIDRLLSESAEERRILFEDFAGISKFKFRKEEAEKKLAQARENLEKLQETIDRLEKEMFTLEQQAQDAEQYNTINNELRDYEVKFEVSRIHNMQREIEKREKEILSLKESLAPLTEKLNEIEQQMKLSDEDLGNKEVLFSSLNEKNLQLEKELSGSKIRLESAIKNLDDAKKRLFELELRSKQDVDRIEELEDNLLDKQDALIDAEKKLAQATQTLEKTEKIQAELKTQAKLIDDQLLAQSKEFGFNHAFSRDDIDSLRKKNIELNGKLYIQESNLISLENELKQKKVLLEEEKEESKKIQEIVNQKQEKKGEILHKKQIIIAQITDLEAQISTLEHQHKSLSEQSKSCDNKILESMDNQILRLKAFQESHSAKKSALTDLLTQTKALLEAGQNIDLSLFEQLQNSILNIEDSYTELLSNLFGEGGAFSEKITISTQIEQLNHQIEQLRIQIKSANGELNQIQEQETEAIQQVIEVETLFSTSEKELAKLDKQISQLQQQLTQEQTVFELEKSQIITNNSKLEKIEKFVAEYELSLSEIRNKNYAIQEESTNARINHNSSETHYNSLKSDIKILEERILDLQKQSSNSNNDMDLQKRLINDLEEEITDLNEEIDELTPQLSQLQDNLKVQFNDIADLRQQKKILEQMHKDNVEQFTKLRMRESEIEGSLSERNGTFTTLKNNFYEQFHVDYLTIVLDSQETTEFLNTKIRRFRDTLNQMGNVNLLAIEQFQNAKETYSTLLFQKEDIEAATNDTEMLIQETNKESADKFLVAFEEIRKSFKNLFGDLFNGGRADLILKDKTNPLQSGIDIMAEPPGQKFQNVSLLSGGQRAMVAIAVIFSILELKPTPFVILDEMDAPLDDENIDRFKRLLVKFKGKSQFVVVSHSKSTLEVCDVLFGVTMEELGCSKIVSVAFSDDEELLFT